MPALLHIAGEPSPSKTEVLALSNKVHEALAAAEKAGYRLQSILGADEGEDERKPKTAEQPSNVASTPLDALERNLPRGSKAESSDTDDSTKDDSETAPSKPMKSQ